MFVIINNKVCVYGEGALYWKVDVLMAWKQNRINDGLGGGVHDANS